MRILLDCSRIATGGAIQNALAVLHNARACGVHTWHVVMTATLSRQVPGSEDSGFASVRRLDTWSQLRTRYTVHLAMPAWERAIAPDVSFAPGGPVYWRSKARQVVAFALPHLIYPECDVFRGMRRLERWRVKLALNAARRSFVQADALVVQTQTVRERLQRVLGVPDSHIRVVQNSFSPVFAASASGVQRRQNHDRFVVLVPSAYYAHKNLESVIDVASLLERRRAGDIEFRFTVPDGSRGWGNILRRAQALGVESMVRTLGTIPHARLAAEYKDADLVFLPTLFECSTAVYPESFMTGTPLITSDLDFARELCGDGAHYVDPHAPAEMADAILEIARNTSSRQSLIAAGKHALATRYLTPEEKWRAQLACLEEQN